MLLIFYIEHTGCVLSIILYPELVWNHDGWACGKMFKVKVLRRIENTFHKIEVLVIQQMLPLTICSFIIAQLSNLQLVKNYLTLKM